MKLILLPSILFLFTTLGSSKPALQKNNDEVFSFMNSYISPHANIFNDIKEKTLNDFQDLRTFVQQKLIGGPIEDSYEEPVALISSEIHQQNNNNNRRLKDAQSQETDRNLAMTCENNGKATTAKVNVYTCNKEVVTKDVYTSLNGVGCKVTKSTTKSVCYCSFEFYGSSCEYLNPLRFEISRLSNIGDCTGQDSFNYVYSYSGAPPCYYVSPDQTVTLLNKIIPSTQYSEYNFEGVKHDFYEVVKQPSLGSKVFTYVIDITDFRLTALSVPDIPQLQVSFMNWVQLSAPAVVQTDLTLTELAGKANVTTPINFDSTIARMAYTGRYYYELAVTSNGTIMSTDYYGGYFEQAGYKEPPGPKKIKVGLIVGLTILGVFLVVGFLIGYRLFRNSKLKVITPETESESDPLMVYGVSEDAFRSPDLSPTPLLSPDSHK